VSAWKKLVQAGHQSISHQQIVADALDAGHILQVRRMNFFFGGPRIQHGNSERKQ